MANEKHSPCKKNILKEKVQKKKTFNLKICPFSPPPAPPPPPPSSQPPNTFLDRVIQSLIKLIQQEFWFQLYNFLVKCSVYIVLQF